MCLPDLCFCIKLGISGCNSCNLLFITSVLFIGKVLSRPNSLADSHSSVFSSIVSFAIRSSALRFNSINVVLSVIKSKSTNSGLFRPRPPLRPPRKSRGNRIIPPAISLNNTCLEFDTVYNISSFDASGVFLNIVSTTKAILFGLLSSNRIARPAACSAFTLERVG